MKKSSITAQWQFAKKSDMIFSKLKLNVANGQNFK